MTNLALQLDPKMQVYDNNVYFGDVYTPVLADVLRKNGFTIKEFDGGHWVRRRYSTEDRPVAPAILFVAHTAALLRHTGRSVQFRAAAPAILYPSCLLEPAPEFSLSPAQERGDKMNKKRWPNPEKVYYIASRGTVAHEAKNCGGLARCRCPITITGGEIIWEIKNENSNLRPCKRCEGMK